MTRRQFLGAGLVIIAVLAGLVAWRHRLRRTVERADDQLRRWRLRGLPRAEALVRYYDYLQLDRPGVEAYVAAYAAAARTHRDLDRAATDFYARYLLSSDFFRYGAREDRVIHYVAFYHPHVNPCVTPFTAG